MSPVGKDFKQRAGLTELYNRDRTYGTRKPVAEAPNVNSQQPAQKNSDSSFVRYNEHVALCESRTYLFDRDGRGLHLNVPHPEALGRQDPAFPECSITAKLGRRTRQATVPTWALPGLATPVSGTGLAAPVAGTGRAGRAERAARRGGALSAGAGERGGFWLRVSVPLADPAPANAVSEPGQERTPS